VRLQRGCLVSMSDIPAVKSLCDAATSTAIDDVVTSLRNDTQNADLS